jgi:transposase
MRWFAKFRSGDESIDEETRGHRPVQVDNDQLRALVESIPRSTVLELAREPGVSGRTFDNSSNK